MSIYIMRIVLLLILVAMAASASITISTDPPIALPGCQDRCANISIPYPFGITPNCAHSSSFEIICNTTSHPPKALLSTLSWKWLTNPPYPIIHPEIRSIDLLGTSNTLVIYAGSAGIGVYSSQQTGVFPLVSLNMTGSPYLLMGGNNSLVVAGCGGSVILRNIRNETVVACSSLCPSLEATQNLNCGAGCSGIGCCQTTIHTSLDFFRIDMLITMVLKGSSTSDLIMGFVSDTSYIQNHNITLHANSTSMLNFDRNVPTTLQWTVPDLPVDSSNYSNSRCEWDAGLKGYSCRCRFEYYQGNPYLPNGCRVIKECKQCPETCGRAVIVGNTMGYRCPTKPKQSVIPLVIGLGISLGTLLVSILLYGMYRLLKQRKEIRQKQENFKRNGGLLLQQQLSSSESALERIKVYTSDELEKATDNFNVSRIVGRGGQGTVYKGMLEDGTIAAIKKSEKVGGSSQLKQFINEVVILSQINHRNVVKLFGCCLETEVPLLVYEYVINGTLSQNIRNPTEEFQLTWKMRLQIAIQSAEALTYLHSSSYPPIYHRDVKTSNILLDDKYRAKVSDFGISKSIEIDQTHVTNTHVEGTFGYIDPEFYWSRKYTDKSDVYSFGVVLVELITSKKAVYEDNSLAINLVSTFLDLKQNSRLYDIVDARVLEEARKEEIEGVAGLAEQCLQMTGIQRPTMKEVATTLLMITSQHCAPNVPSSKQVSNGELDLIGEFSSCSSITYSSSDWDAPYTQEQPLYSSTSLSSDLCM